MFNPTVVAILGSRGWTPNDGVSYTYDIGDEKVFYFDTLEEAAKVATEKHVPNVETCYGKTASNKEMDKTKPYFCLVQPYKTTKND